MTKKTLDDLPDQKPRNIKKLVGEPEKVDKDSWRYSVKKEMSMPVEDKEIYMASDEEGEQVYGGKFVRDLFESRRYRPKSYTWLGYVRNPKKGLNEAGIPHEALFKHTAIFGNSGYGKSTVMKNMMLQWAQAGYGFCFIDPKGDDTPKMLNTLPEHRLDDIVWFEPGATADRDTVGFNLFETNAEPGTKEQKSEANAIVEDLLSLFEAKSMMWNPQLEGVISSILERMIKSKKNFSLGDLYKVLNSESEREVFVEMYEEELTNMEKEYIENVRQAELDGLIETLKNMLSKPIIKEVIAKNSTEINISQAIEDDKIILANFSNISEEDLKFVTAAFVRRIWSTIKSRKDIPENEREPYFLCIDEFDNTTKDFPDEDDLLQIGEILSTARSYRLSCMIANQNPTQLSDDIKEDVFGNCNNLFTFNQGNMQDAGELAKPLEDVQMRDITMLDQFKLIGKLTIDGKKTDGLLINTFPEYPPLRKQDESNELLSKICEKYGTVGREEFDEDNYGVIRYMEEEDSQTRENIGNMIVDTIGILSLIRSGELNPKNKDNKLLDMELEEVFDPHIYKSANFYREVKKRLINSHIGDEIKEINEENNSYYKISPEGESKLKNSMDDLAFNTHKALSEKGYYIGKPFKLVNRNVYNYDLIGYPPVQPVRQAQTMENAEKLKKHLKSQYEDIYEISKDKRILVKIVRNPEESLDQVFLAISDAKEKSVCLLMCENKKKAQKLKEIMESDNYYKDEENEELYTTQNPIDLENNNRPIRKEPIKWKKSKDGDIVLEYQKSERKVSFEDFEELSNNSKKKDYNYYLSEGDSDVKILDSEDDQAVNKFETVRKVKESDNYHIINKPFIPDNYLISMKGWKIVYLEGDNIKTL